MFRSVFFVHLPSYTSSLWFFCFIFATPLCTIPYLECRSSLNGFVYAFCILCNCMQTNIESQKLNMCTNCCGNHLIWLVLCFFLLFCIMKSRIESIFFLSMTSMNSKQWMAFSWKMGVDPLGQLSRAHVH